MGIVADFKNLFPGRKISDKQFARTAHGRVDEVEAAGLDIVGTDDVVCCTAGAVSELGIVVFDVDATGSREVSTVGLRLDVSAAGAMSEWIQGKATGAANRSNDIGRQSNNYAISDAPDHDLEIPGETILCKSDAEDKYWPASLINYLGIRNRDSIISTFDHTSRSEKYYSVEFFDGTCSEVPRSFFFTSAEREFHTVKVGRIKTTEMKYKEFLPILIEILPDVEEILAGTASDDGVKQRHNNFLESNYILEGSILEKWRTIGRTNRFSNFSAF
ncbi:hypothetical protein PtB15_10B243 [Puccinia triticina]|nr:hypothetical protein PtB15_10B243 [Puccinia triticina]